MKDATTTAVSVLVTGEPAETDSDLGFSGKTICGLGSNQFGDACIIMFHAAQRAFNSKVGTASQSMFTCSTELHGRGVQASTGACSLIHRERCCSTCTQTFSAWDPPQCRLGCCIEPAPGVILHDLASCYAVHQWLALMSASSGGQLQQLALPGDGAGPATPAC